MEELLLYIILGSGVLLCGVILLIITNGRQRYSQGVLFGWKLALFLFVFALISSALAEAIDVVSAPARIVLISVALGDLVWFAWSHSAVQELRKLRPKAEAWNNMIEKNPSFQLFYSTQDKVVCPSCGHVNVQTAVLCEKCCKQM